uniref:Uncharacterized protein n=1 Tax=uncultured prokaryote TaxID=198431 RepID=A0A0H5QLF5_9ZZZZ|nr:hypothetical protein [uncultured prokaryote]
MTFPRPHLYLTWGGTSWLAAEIWQCGIRWDRPTLPDQATFDALEPHLIEFHQTAGLITSNAQLSWYKLALILENGRYPEDAEAMLNDLDPVVSGASGAVTYPQVACKVTLRTARRRGRGHVGGFYIPCPAMTPNGLGQNEGYAATAAQVAVDLIDSVSATLEAPAVIGSFLGTGRLEPVTAVTVGSVADTQRKRRNALQEVYSTPLPVNP